MTITTYPYLISESYCQNWTPTMAIRELIANALDASAPEDITFDWDCGMGYIFNKNVYLQKEHLLLGESNKESNQIRQFGEGLKIAALALCRNEHKVWAASGLNRYEFTTQDNTDFNRKVLMVSISTSGDNVEGTRVAFACQKAAFDEAKSLFLKLLPESKSVLVHGDNFILLEQRGDVYVLGVKVSYIPNSIFGYNLGDKKLINRDRTVIDHKSLSVAVRSVLASCTSIDMVKQLLTACMADPSCYEAGLTAYYTWADWYVILQELVGKKVCLISTDYNANTRAAYLGYTVVNLGEGLNDTLGHTTKIKRAHDIHPEAVTNIIPPESLPSAFTKRIEKARLKVQSLIGFTFSAIHLTDDLGEIEGQRQGAVVFLNHKKAVKHTIYDLIAILLHEAAHIESGKEDCTAEFEAQLTDYFRRMISPKKKGEQR
jgi:hypothetical protein